MEKRTPNIKTPKKYTVEEKDAIFALPLKEQFVEVYTHPESGFSVYRHILLEEQDDYDRILNVAKALSQYGHCRINPVIVPMAREGRAKVYPGIDNKSNPDLTTALGYLDVKSPNNLHNIVSNANHACRQCAVAVLTDDFLKELIDEKRMRLTTASIFSEKNVDQIGNPNYTKDTVYWFVEGTLYKFNRPEEF